jgi:aminomethyltransferase
MDDLERSPLDEAHRRLGAKMVPFGGWEMPVAYPSGTIAEHLACRQRAVVFDVSHLGTVRVGGPDAFERLQWALTNDLTKIGPGRAQYTHLLDEHDGSVLDDIIVWWLDDELFDVMPNASNTDGVQEALGGQETTHSRAVLAIQGPEARAMVGTVSPEAAAVGRFRVERVVWDGVPIVAAGTGYTGEDGIEIAVPAEAAPRLWDALTAAGALPAGLGARDTLRLEAALPLHGHELGPGITPLQAGLGWVVGWKKGEFRGRRPLEVEMATGPARRLRGIATDGRRPARDGCPVLAGGDVVGTVTSGNFSPVLGHGIALALLSPDLDDATAVTIDVRGSELSGTIVATPFVRR